MDMAYRWTVLYSLLLFATAAIASQLILSCHNRFLIELHIIPFTGTLTTERRLLSATPQAMPEMEKENLIDPENGALSPSMAHQTTDIGLKAIELASAMPEMNNTEDSDSHGLRTKDFSESFGSHKIERFLSPSPISRQSMDAQGMDSEEEEVSRSTEDSQSVTDWNRNRLIRPQTAPLMIDTDTKSNDHVLEPSEIRTKSVPLSYTAPSPSIVDDSKPPQTCNASEDQLELSKEKAWHPHVYAKPPKQPTPHSINDILGLSRTRLDSGSNGDFYKEESSRHSFHRMGSSTSMSESSDSEEQFRGSSGVDQPLNLCLSKSRSDSPLDDRRQSKASRKGE